MLLAPTCHRCASRRASPAKDHAPTDGAPGRRRSDLEIRVAAPSPPGAHGEPHRSELSSAVLASWATSTGEIPRRRRRMSHEQVPCPRLLVDLVKGKRESLVRSDRKSCILARLLRGLTASRTDSSSNGRPPISSGCVAPEANAPGLTAGARVGGPAAVRAQTPPRAGLQRSARAPKPPREVIRRHAGCVRSHSGLRIGRDRASAQSSWVW
jgi:hypothetical protein